MNDIQNIDTYIKSMSTTLYDKCWWIDKISPEIDTVVDYGCAQGDLAILIDRISPGSFKYIGVDNSQEMLALAAHNHRLHFSKRDSEFLSEISDISEHCDTRKSILVLNSVMHEIFSYLSVEERKALLSEMFSAGFAYVAIRDMYMPMPEEIEFAQNKFISAINSSKYAGLWVEFNEYLEQHQRENTAWENPSLRAVEFLMKYRYIANWEREMKETYFWDWIPELASASGKERMAYKISYINRFYIPFIRNKVRDDFGVDFPYTTHIKVLLSR